MGGGVVIRIIAVLGYIESLERRAREACFVEGAYCTQDLFYARAETAYTRQAVLLKTKH